MPGGVRRSGSAAGPCAFSLATQSRTICTVTPPITAASVRVAPSSIAASVRSRRVWLASLLTRAAQAGKQRGNQERVEAACGPFQGLASESEVYRVGEAPGVMSDGSWYQVPRMNSSPEKTRLRKRTFRRFFRY